MLDDVVKVHRPGARVKVAGDIDATITAVQVWDGGHVVYQVVWWADGQRRAEWVEPCEVQVGDGYKPARIGFGT